MSWSKIVAVNLTGSDQAIAAANFHGFSVKETAGSTASFIVYNAASATGTILEEVTLAANQSAREFYREGVRADVGIYVDIVSGSVAGSVRVS